MEEIEKGSAEDVSEGSKERVWEPRLFIRKQVTSKVTSEQQKI